MRNRNELFSLAAACIGILLSLPGHARSPVTECGVSSLDIKTGVDEMSNTLLPLGNADQSWMVISDPDSGTTEPRPAIAIPTYSAWSAPFPGTEWISSYGTATNELNGLYQLESCFCLRPDFKNPKLNISLLADDWAEVFLNNNSIGKTTAPYNFQTPTALSTTDPTLFKVGRNCIRVDLKNTGNVAMGLDLSATLQSSGIGIDKPACCDTTGSLSGSKWEDLNGDGVRQTGEPAIPGWVIKLSNGAVAMTDSNGDYYFVNLPAGNYVVAEQVQAGWQQTFPLTGTHTVALAAGQAVNKLDFGNRKCRQCAEGQIVFVPAGGNSADLCSRLCCKKGEYFFQNSCGCGCSTKPPCPELGAPGIRYVSRDPAVCATIRFTCRRSERPFSNECGCGCKSAIEISDPTNSSNQ